MKQRWGQLNNSNGGVTIAALLILAVLTIIGISSISTSNMEVQIATNDKVHKMAFYARRRRRRTWNRAAGAQYRLRSAALQTMTCR